MFKKFVEYVRSGDLFLLKEFGENLLTKQVKIWQSIFTIILSGTFLFDLVVWSALWRLAVHSWVLAVPFGFIFAVMIAGVGRAVVTAALGKQLAWVAGFVLRIVLLVAVMRVTAIPVQLWAFSSEIDAKISEEWQTQQSKVAKESHQELVAPLGDETEEINKRAAGDETLQKLRQQQKDLLELITREEAGDKGWYQGVKLSGQRRCGVKCLAHKATLAELDQRIANLQVAISADVRAGRVAREKSRAQMIAQHKAELLTLTSAETPEHVVRQYGLLKRRQILEKLRQSDSKLDSTATIWEWVVMVMGILDVIFKALAPKKFNEYYSLEAQDAAAKKKEDEERQAKEDAAKAKAEEKRQEQEERRKVEEEARRPQEEAKQAAAEQKRREDAAAAQAAQAKAEAEQQKREREGQHRAALNQYQSALEDWKSARSNFLFQLHQVAPSFTTLDEARSKAHELWQELMAQKQLQVEYARDQPRECGDNLPPLPSLFWWKKSEQKGKDPWDLTEEDFAWILYGQETAPKRATLSWAQSPSPVRQTTDIVGQVFAHLAEQGRVQKANGKASASGQSPANGNSPIVLPESQLGIRSLSDKSMRVQFRRHLSRHGRHV